MYEKDIANNSKKKEETMDSVMTVITWILKS